MIAVLFLFGFPFIGALLTVLFMFVALVGVVFQLVERIKVVLFAAFTTRIRPLDIEADRTIDATWPIFIPDPDVAR